MGIDSAAIYSFLFFNIVVSMKRPPYFDMRRLAVGRAPLLFSFGRLL